MTATAAALELTAADTGLRIWQRRALTRYLAQRPEDFLLVATPGAGKTAWALRIASELLADGTIAAITVVTPTEHLKVQWAKAAAARGIALDPTFRNSQGSVASDFRGVAVTYAQVAAHPQLHRARTEQRRTLVILDEIHHAGDAMSWGDAVREAFAPAARRIGLTGTPFRSDDSPIPFVRYERSSAGYLHSASDYRYSYGDALRDGVVRPVLFLAYAGEARWRTNAGEEHSAQLGEELTTEQTTRAWRTALDPRGDWIPAVFTAADRRLTQLRDGGMSDAGGLVIASDHQAARAYAVVLHRISGEQPVVVLSDDRGASSKITEFSESTARWLIAVRMVSEGVDVPRLAVGVYATSVNTPLFFAQAIGRFVRVRQRGETASVFLPSVPSLLGLAGEMEEERDHVLGKPTREQLWDEAAVAQAGKQQDELTDVDRGFEALAASAHLDQVIFDGASFGTGAVPGTPEEQEYLGLPGLLEPAEVAMLLRRRQQEMAAKKGAQAAPAGQAHVDRLEGTHELRAGLRKELNALVAAYHHRTGQPHGVIHAELRKLCGGPQTALANIDQLRRRLDTIRNWAASNRR